MAEELKGQKIAVLATDGVEQVELTEPVKALKSAGAEVKVVSNKEDEIQGFKHHDKGTKISVDESLDEAEPDDFDGLVLPGGGDQSRRASASPAGNRFHSPFCCTEETDRGDLPRAVDFD
jgi:putative intracellular protease/amidase